MIEARRRVSPPPDRKLRLPLSQARFPLLPNRRLDVEDCTCDDLIALQNALGLSRALLDLLSTWIPGEDTPRV